MGKEQIISKGKYALAQPANMVGVKQYLFVRDEDGKKRLLLRFANNRQEKCSKFAFILYRLDAKGNVLGQDKYESADKEFAENEVFSFDRRIAVEEKCSNFRVQMVYARYGNYTYNVEHENVSVAYSEMNTAVVDNARAATKVKPRKINTRTFDLPWLYVILSVLMLSLVIFACAYLLNDFMKTEIDFTLSGVSYRFVDKDKKTDVIIMGCADTYSEITLTGEIEGHAVVGIDEDAFEGNKKLEKITVDGLNIPDRAFENCKKLETLVIRNVTEIGERAFASCSALATVSIVEGKAGQVISIGKRAFADCRSLNSVEIKQTVAYGENVDYFYKSTGIQTLTLKNFAFTVKGLESEYVTRIAALFGEENEEKPSAKLVNLTVEKMDAIPQDFVYGFRFLKNVTVSGVEIKSVGDYAFADCVSLTKLSLKGKLTSIGDYAFSNTNIQTLDMSKVSSLGQGVFKNCDMLTSVTGFGDGGLDSIPRYTFEGCIALKTFEINKKTKNIKHIFKEAFKGSGLTYISIPVGVSYDEGILRDCKKLERLDVHEFGAAGYVGQLFGAPRGAGVSSEDMASYIPNTLVTVNLGTGTEINESAFMGCKNVTTIGLPEDIVSIGANAFSGCKKLTVVDIPADSLTLKTIGEKAFYKCEKLMYAPLPESIEKIGASAFEGCNSLESITLPFLGETSKVDDNETVSHVFGGAVPASIKEISLLDANLTDIPASAFKGCAGVKKIIIPNNAVSVGASAFEGCTALTTVALSDGTSKDIGADLTKMINVGARAFLNCKALATVEFSDRLDIIGNGAFSGTGLLKLSVPSSVGYMGEGILEGCNSIGTIDLPYLGADANANGGVGYFFGNNVPGSLKVVSVAYFKDNVIGADAFSGCSNVTSFNLPSGIVAIGESAFANCSSMSSFSFGEILSVGDMAFSGCKALKDVDLSRIEFIGNNSFYACESISKAVLSSVKKIGSEAFEKCNALSIVTIGESATVIGNSAFYETAIKSVVVPEGVVTLGDYVFGKCTALASVQLPSTLTKIGDGVFKETAITSISIPDSVTYIGGFAFDGTGIKTLKIPANATYVGTNVIRGCNKLESFEFPITSEMDGRSLAEYLCGYAFPKTLKKITINGSALKSLHSYAFNNCVDLEEVIIDAKLHDIYWGAFNYCTQLKFVSLPSSISHVADSAFSDCYRLYEIANPSGVPVSCDYTISYAPSLQERARTVEQNGCKFAYYGNEWYLIEYTSENVVADGVAGIISEYKIPPYLFYNDSSLKTVTLKGTVSEIGRNAFRYCEGLTSVTLPSSVTYIDDGAFANCGNLTEVVMPTELKGIGNYAFNSCYSLNNIKLYSKLVSIGDDAFYGCQGLYDVYSTSRLNLVAGSMSYGYVARRAVKIHTNMDEAPSTQVDVQNIGTFRRSGDAWLLISGANVKELTLGSFVHEGVNVASYRIAEYAFRYSHSLQKLVIDNAVDQIQWGAFEDCDSLKSVDFSGNTSLTELEGYTFYSCNYLTDVKLPSSVKLISYYVFSDCERLETVKMPTALERICEGAFQGCERLLSITLYQNVKQIDSGAFDGCTYLLEVYDLSPDITVTTTGNGRYENGGVAQNAAAVFTSLDLSLERKEQNGIKFIKGGNAWYLYGFDDKGQTVLEVPNLGGNLIIMPKSILNGTFEGIVFPSNLIYVDYDAIWSCESFSSVYYMGNRSAWLNIQGKDVFSGFQTVYYKENCVHYNSSNAWTRDKNGNVTTAICDEISEITKNETCYENGVRTYYCACSGCTYSRTETIDSQGHQLEGDVCKRCGETRTHVNGDNLDDYVENGAIIVEGFEYDSENKRFVSLNVDSNEVTYFAIMADKRMTVSLTIGINGYYYSDFVYVYVGDGNGSDYVERSVTGSESVKYNTQLEAGEYIIIAFERGNEDSYEGNCGYIKDLQIIEMIEQQSN